MAHTELLKNVNLFDNLSIAELENLSHCFVEKTYFRDNFICMQNDPGNAMFIIKSGKIKIIREGTNGREIILSIFKPGEFFGEMSLLDGQARSASAVAMEDSQLLVLERAAFVQHINNSSQTALNILSEMSVRLRHADEIISNLALLDVYKRLWHQLLKMGKQEGEQMEDGTIIKNRPTHQELSSMIGTTRETVSRIVAEFQRRGLIEVTGKKLLLRPAFYFHEN